ncbi:hypothetical protein [Shewanella colwelliana]|uniref:hypothetical protein n=1 Tax=Shewanella colwelliana TaxID=23 RepID=UPI00048B3306|nr:hypothetical protein [Shewanella colwelliana]
MLDNKQIGKLKKTQLKSKLTSYSKNGFLKESINCNPNILLSMLEKEIYVVTSRGQKIEEREDIVLTWDKIHKKSSYIEQLEYTGKPLSVEKDFILISFLHEYAYSTQQQKILISDNELCKLTFSKVSPANKEQIEDTLKALWRCTLSLSIIDSNDKELYTEGGAIIQYSKYLKSEGIYEIDVHPLFLSQNIFSYRRFINMRYYNLLTSAFAKTLFLYYETCNFNNDIRRNIKTLRKRVQSKLRIANVNQKIRHAHEQLKEVGYLDDYLEDGHGDSRVYTVFKGKSELQKEREMIKDVLRRHGGSS